VSFLFVFRAASDIDHTTPLAWKLLDQGEEVHAIVSQGSAPAGDHRIKLLHGYDGFHLHEAWPRESGGGLRARVSALRGYLRSTLPYALLFLATKRVRLIGVEWGYGLPPGYESLLSRRGVVATLRSLGRSFLKNRSDHAQVRNNFIVAGRLLRIPTVCLPHGLSIKLDAVTNETVAKLLEKGPLDWTDRNRFSVFVSNTESHRQWHLENAKGDPEVMQTWGSLRWSPEWFEINRREAPDFEWPEQTDLLKVVFMVPKWRNRVHADETVELVRRLSRLDCISLGVMGHPRGKVGGADPLHAADGIDWDRIQDVSGVNSVSLIAASDVVLDVGSSIGIEVVMQGKVLVNPTYIHELTTLFDTIAGSAVVANSADEVVDYLRAHAAGNPHEVAPAAYEELMREAVYGSRDEPFDVMAEYTTKIKTLATGNGFTQTELQDERRASSG
jgi:hypothetical protein